MVFALAACGAPPQADEPQSNNAEAPAAVEAGLNASAPSTEAPPAASGPPAQAPAQAPSPGWETAASGEGDALFLAGADGRRSVTLFCPAGSGDLVVNVTGFHPIGSEERMSFGSGGTAIVLVADSRGDQQRGGVTGRGPIPDELAAILASPDGVSVNYGAQDSGPHRIGKEAADTFLRGCRD